MSSLKCKLFGHNYIPRQAGDGLISKSIDVWIATEHGYRKEQAYVECLASCFRINCGEHMWELAPKHPEESKIVDELTVEAQKLGLYDHHKR